MKNEFLIKKRCTHYTDNGTKWLYVLSTNGWCLHCEDGPAVEFADGSKIWYLNGERHREDGPAIEFAIGTKKWYLNGELHREDGPAVEHSYGKKEWYLNGVKLRVRTLAGLKKKIALMICEEIMAA